MRAVVVALGKIGLPLAVQIANAGNEVVGCDIDERVVELVRAGKVPFPNEPGIAEALPIEASEDMLEILHAQEFNSGIPAGLPESARVAHKTGEISTVAHDAGLVYLPDRQPYVLVILTSWERERGGRHETIARISEAVHEELTEVDA